MQDVLLQAQLWLTALGILGIFAAGAALMFTRALPALITLPLMSVAIVCIAAVIMGNITLVDILGGVGQEGAFRLHDAMIIAFFGGVLSFMMQKSGVAQSLIKNGAELVGDKPLQVSIFVMALVAMLFTSIGGLGAVIMVSMVVLPVLSTLGVPPIVCGGILLVGISLGGLLNPGNWVLYTSVLKLDVADVRNFALVTVGLLGITGVTFIAVELYRARVIRTLREVATPIILASIIGLGLAGGIVSSGNPFAKEIASSAADAAAAATDRPATTEADAFAEPEAPAAAGADDATTTATAAAAADARNAGEAPGEDGLMAMIGAIQSVLMNALRVICVVGFFAILGIAIADILKRVRHWRHQEVTIQWYAYLIPVVPIVPLILFNWFPMIGAFLIGVTFAFIVTARPGSISMLIQSMIQGSSAVMPAVLLMVGIGMLLKAVSGPETWQNRSDYHIMAEIQNHYRDASFTNAILMENDAEAARLLDEVTQRNGGVRTLMARTGSTVGVALRARDFDKVREVLLQDPYIAAAASEGRELGVAGEVVTYRGTWPVRSAIEPFIRLILPSSGWGYALMFGLLAPLALYRGPLNVWGLGGGLMAIFLAAGLPPEAIMAMFITVGMIQGICDPTNTLNVWLANELRVDVAQLMWRTLPYVWVMVFAGLSLAAFWFDIGTSLALVK